MFYRVGFTSDWDVLFIADVRVKCMLIGLAFDMAGYLLMSLPYLFFWDYTDEKHRFIMEELQKRADALAAQGTGGKSVAEAIETAAAAPAEQT